MCIRDRTYLRAVRLWSTPAVTVSVPLVNWRRPCELSNRLHAEERPKRLFVTVEGGPRPTSSEISQFVSNTMIPESK